MVVDKRIFTRSRGEGESAVVRRIAAELIKFDSYDLSELIFDIASNKHLPKSLNPLYGEGRDHYDIVNAVTRLKSNNYVYWLVGLFHHNREEIKDFNNLRTLINVRVLQGDVSGARSLLDRVDIICKSWWSIEQNIHITKEIEGKETLHYIMSIPDRFAGDDVNYMVQLYQIMSEANPISFFVSTLNDRMKEYRISGIEKAIQNGVLNSCRFLPINLDSEREVALEFLANEWYSSIIDQYVLFKSIVAELSVKGELAADLVKKIAELANTLGDEELSALVDPIIETDATVKSIIDDYTRGNYKGVVVRVKRLLLDGDQAIFGVLEIYAKSKIYTGRLNDSSTFYDILANNFGRLLQSDHKTNDIIDYLGTVCVKFRAERWAKSLNFHFFATLKNLYPSDKVELARMATICLGALNTPKAQFQDFKLVPNEQEIKELPFHRAARYLPDQVDPDSIEVSKFPILSDYLFLRSSAYMSRGEHIKAVNFVIDEYLKNNLTYLFLPVKELCVSVGAVEKVDNNTFISILMIYEIYSRENSSAFEEEKKDLFEEMMEFNETYRPSSIFARGEVLSHRDIFFLRNLCIPAQLDNLRQYTSNDEVVNERVAILDLLITRKVEDSDRLKQEKDQVMESLLSEKLRAKIESGKLFVDVQALQSHRKHIYETLFSLARSVKDTEKMTPIESQADLVESSDVLAFSQQRAVASNKKTALMYSIFNQAVEDFALNENYGLDKYLSAEIRHVVFVSQLRSCFERTKLITNQKNGSYLSNEYWKAHYTYVHHSITDDIDVALIEFSKAVDLILEEVNERFKVEISERESAKVFDFVPYFRRLVKVSEIADASKDHQDFLSGLIDYMWELAAEGARSAQTLISDYLTSRVSEAISELELNITSARKNVGVLDLLQEVKNARSLFTNEIELVLNWFRFVGTDDSRNLEGLGVVLEAAISSFNSVYGHKGRELIFSQQKSSLSLNYREARALFISLLTALENALKYGDAQMPPMVEHYIEASYEYIKIVNKFSEDLEELPTDIISREKSKWNAEHSELNTKEGGSGLYKIYSLLSSASPGFNFDIKVDEDMFVLLIGLNNEYFDNRRQSIKA